MGNETESLHTGPNSSACGRQVSTCLRSPLRVAKTYKHTRQREEEALWGAFKKDNSLHAYTRNNSQHFCLSDLAIQLRTEIICDVQTQGWHFP